jgi:hypothetical protein
MTHCRHALGGPVKRLARAPAHPRVDRDARPLSKGPVGSVSLRA